MDKIEEQHAIEAARREIEVYIAQDFLGANRDWLEAWSTHRIAYDPNRDAFPRLPAEELGRLCSNARRNIYIFRLAKFLASKRLDAGQPVPPPLSDLISAYLKGEFEPSGPGSGRPENWGRDIVIQLVMMGLLERYDINATRRLQRTATHAPVGKNRRSASELVQTALETTRVGSMSLKRIQDIWSDKGKRAACDRYWKHALRGRFDPEPELELI